MLKKINKIIFIINCLFQIQKHSPKERLNNFSKLLQAYWKVKNNNLSNQEKYIFSELENYRRELLISNIKINYEFFGTSDTRKVSDIVKRASSNEKWSKFYYLISQNISANNILEIGTNVGISGQYFLQSLIDNNEAGNRYFLTFEGEKDLCKIADERFEKIAQNKLDYEIIEGLFDNTLKKTLDKKQKKFDLVFIDGNHNFEATLNYFKIVKNYTNENSVFIFDDINWSKDMMRAWNLLKRNRSIAVDMHKIGILIFSDKITKSQMEKLYLGF